MATIDYPGGDDPCSKKKGTLLFLKASYYGTEPPDIRSYQATHPDFPHESTLDQWFSESQMESYRALGEYIVTDLGKKLGEREAGAELSLAQFMENAKEHYYQSPLKDWYAETGKPAAA